MNLPLLPASALAQNLPAALMILIFLVMTGLMYMRKISALLALPIMALAFALVGMVRVRDFFQILGDALPGEARGFLAGSVVVWILVVAAAVWARRARRVSGAVAFGIPFVALAVLAILNEGALAALTAQNLWDDLFACLESQAILGTVVHDGALRLHEAYTIAFFGGMLAIYVREKKLAETLIKYAAELGGDKPLIVAIVMMLATLALFTTLGGLGAIIMVGTIIMPIMLSLGLSPFVVAGVFLIGVCAGGTFNPTGWALYRESLQLDIGDIQQFALLMVLIYVVTGIAFVALSTRGKWRRRRWTWAAAADPEGSARARVRPIALLTPIIPIILVFKLTIFAELFLYLKNVTLFMVFEFVLVGGLAVLALSIAIVSRFVRRTSPPSSPLWFVAGIALAAGHIALYVGPDRWLFGLQDSILKFLGGFERFAGFWDRYIGGWNFIPAFLAGIVFCLLTTWERGGNNVQMLTKSVIEGAESVMPAVLLMCGIGMLLNVVMNPQISGYLKPLIAAVTPSNKVTYIVGFGLAAPLALYRGPLNVWGLGLGIAGVMLQTDRLSAALLMGMFMSVGAVQGVCDPTNTHNVWIANFLGEDVLAITRFLLPYIWAMVFVGLIVAGVLFKI